MQHTHRKVFAMPQSTPITWGDVARLKNALAEVQGIFSAPLNLQAQLAEVRRHILKEAQKKAKQLFPSYSTCKSSKEISKMTEVAEQVDGIHKGINASLREEIQKKETEISEKYSKQATKNSAFKKQEETFKQNITQCDSDKQEVLKQWEPIAAKLESLTKKRKETLSALPDPGALKARNDTLTRLADQFKKSKKDAIVRVDIPQKQALMSDSIVALVSELMRGDEDASPHTEMKGYTPPTISAPSTDATSVEVTDDISTLFNIVVQIARDLINALGSQQPPSLEKMAAFDKRIRECSEDINISVAGVGEHGKILKKVVEMMELTRKELEEKLKLQTKLQMQDAKIQEITKTNEGFKLAVRRFDDAKESLKKEYHDIKTRYETSRRKRSQKIAQLEAEKKDIQKRLEAHDIKVGEWTDFISRNRQMTWFSPTVDQSAAVNEEVGMPNQWLANPTEREIDPDKVVEPHFFTPLSTVMTPRETEALSGLVDLVDKDVIVIVCGQESLRDHGSSTVWESGKIAKLIDKKRWQIKPPDPSTLSDETLVLVFPNLEDIQQFVRRHYRVQNLYVVQSSEDAVATQEAIKACRDTVSLKKSGPLEYLRLNQIDENKELKIVFEKIRHCFRATIIAMITITGVLVLLVMLLDDKIGTRTKAN